jgi:hypothetical protein
MQSYQSNVESFLSCQRSEIEDKRREIEDLESKNRRVIQERNDAVESFNRRARD